jgi:hypothetical protein
MLEMINYNKNFNVLLSTSGRTGSNVILNFLTQSANFLKKIRYHWENQDLLSSGEILHSHSIEDLKLINENTLCVFSIRNLFDTLISYKIGEHEKNWVRQNNFSNQISSFLIDKTEIINDYQRLVRYYKTISTQLPNNTIIIEYSQFSTDPDNLYNIFKIDPKNKKFYKPKYPFKTPGSHADWIINYKELSEIFKSLETNPYNLLT